MSTIKSSAENLTLNADGSGNDIKFQSNASEVAEITDGGVISSTGGSTHADNVKAKFGTGNDLEIYHSGSNSMIRDTGTGGIYIEASGFYVTNAAGAENMVEAIEDGAVSLYHNNVKQLETSTTGIKLGFADNGVITSTYGVVLETTGSEPVVIKTGGSERVKVHGSGTTSFNNGVVLGAGVADTAANTLDDYEEGTWTLGMGNVTEVGTCTFVSTYTKIGNVVTVCSYQTAGEVERTSAAGYFTGLPFTPSENAFGGGALIDGSPTKWVGLAIYPATSLYLTGTFAQDDLRLYATYVTDA